MFIFSRTHWSRAACVFRHLRDIHVTIKIHIDAKLYRWRISFKSFPLAMRNNKNVTYGENSSVPDDLSRQYMYALKSSKQFFFIFLRTSNAQAVTAFPSLRQRRGSLSSCLHNINSWKGEINFSQSRDSWSILDGLSTWNTFSEIYEKSNLVFKNSRYLILLRISRLLSQCVRVRVYLNGICSRKNNRSFITWQFCLFLEWDQCEMMNESQ